MRKARREKKTHASRLDNRLQAAFHLRSSVQRRSPLEVRGLPELRPTPPSERGPASQASDPARAAQDPARIWLASISSGAALTTLADSTLSLLVVPPLSGLATSCPRRTPPVTAW